MPRRIVRKAAFERAYLRLTDAQQHLVDSALRQFQHYLQTGTASAGLGVRHLAGRTYEFRVSVALRVVYVIDKEHDAVVLALLGNHDEVRRFLRRQ